MMNALDRAATTDLLTGLPDRDLFNRRLLPRTLEEHDRVALVVVDIVDFSDAVAAGTITRVRETLLRLADAVEEAVSEEAVRAAVQGRRDLRHRSQYKRRGRLPTGGAG
jgi:GGDEF domain-containing protein